MGEGEQMYQACAGRERRLQRLRGWMAQLEQHLRRSKQPAGQTLARRALLEQEVGRYDTSTAPALITVL